MTNQEILQKMEEEIRLRGLSKHTHDEYICRAKLLMAYADRPLEELTEQDLRDYLLYLLDVKKLSTGSINVYNSAIRFIYGAILHRHLNYYDIPRFKKVHALPTVLTRQEVFSILESASSLRDRAMLMTIYGGGLRISEIVSLKTADIHASSMRILIRQGKGRKDRYTLLSKKNLDILTEYWRTYRPEHPDGYLFLNRSNNRMSTKAVSDIFKKALDRSGVGKPATVHTLRHCFATHILEDGADVCQIKKLLGHSHIQTTTQYLHLINFEDSLKSPLDSVASGSGVD